MPPTSRQLLQAKALGIENDLRGPLPFCLKVGTVGTVKFRLEFVTCSGPSELGRDRRTAADCRQGSAPAPRCASLQLLEIVRHDEVCRRQMTTPDVGPVVALALRAMIGGPSWSGATERH
jgi:transposase